jgi:putative ABC transport system permease protein
VRYAGLIFANLRRNKRRTILTTLSIAASLFVFSALASLPNVAEQILSDRASLRVLCHSKAGILYPLPEAYRQRIVGKQHVELVAAFSFFGGIYHEPSDQFPNAAIDHEQVEEMWPDWGISGQAARDFKRLRTACLVGGALMRRFDWRLGQQIMLRGTVYPINLTLQIVGVLGDRAPPPVLLFRRDYLEEALGHSGLVNMFWVRVDRAESIPAVIADLDHTFANSDAETQTESEMGFFSNAIANFRTIFAAARVLGMIVVITISLIAANTAAMSIRERGAEVAIMRSIGFSSTQVLSCLLAESVIVALVGGVVGSAVASLALRSLALGSAVLGPLGIALRVPSSVIAQSLAVALLIGAASGLFPALAAARGNIAERLRFVA